MYKLVYYFKRTEGLVSEKRDYERYEDESTKFRLRRNAIHFISEILKQDYIKAGYAAETIVGGISLYKSEKAEYGDRMITEIMIKAEKVGQ